MLLHKTWRKRNWVLLRDLEHKDDATDDDDAIDQCDQMGDFLHFGQLFKAFGSN